MRGEHIKYFLSLVQTNSIQQTSLELYTTRQNVSKMIRQLENELDIELFLRSKKGVELTPAGKLFLPIAKQTVQEFGRFRANISALKKGADVTGELHILSSDMVSFTAISPLIQLFTELYPMLNVHLEIKEPLSILQKIALYPQLVGIVVILNNPEFHKLYMPYIQQIQLTPLLQDDYSCIVGAQSPLNKHKSISLTEFAQQPFATTTLNEDGKNVLTNLIASYGGTVSFGTNSLHSYNNALLNGRYVGLSSNISHRKSVEENSKFAQLHLIPFEEDMSFSISLAIHQRSQLNKAGEIFVEFMENNKLYF